jgi:hypothetical protein
MALIVMRILARLDVSQMLVEDDPLTLSATGFLAIEIRVQRPLVLGVKNGKINAIAAKSADTPA